MQAVHKFPWQIHVDVWQNQYSIVKQKKKKNLNCIGKKKPTTIL